ncbi:hypothetical protein Cflav_PD2108 [Pedosphaera parvula Ellin514]|uniref:Uncharacterized protein n=1 Tax=Pedosphaera parvula (strain Ellin514) TaxID=320771 RepID=B9XLK9_PEDPL|nr:hypothetical protein Cflav_PD2108 [Pedosphaera parvula Ellin514]
MVIEVLSDQVRKPLTGPPDILSPFKCSRGEEGIWVGQRRVFHSQTVS